MKSNICARAGAITVVSALTLMIVGCTEVVNPQPYGVGTYGVVTQPVYTARPVYVTQPVYTNYGYAPYGYYNNNYYTGYNPANAIVPGLVGFGLGAAVYGHNYRDYHNNYNYTYINRGGGYRGGYHGGYHGGWRH